MPLFVWENTKHIVRASTMIDRVCKRCYLCSCKNRLFVFCLIYLAHMGRWNEASDVYQKSNWGGTGSFRLEKIYYLWSWSRLGIPCSASVSLVRFLGWAVSFFHTGPFKGYFWDSFPCLPVLRVVLWNAEGCPAPLSIAPQTPSPCTLLASAVRFADVSTDWGSGWPSVLWRLFFPLCYSPSWLTLMKWSHQQVM